MINYGIFAKEETFNGKEIFIWATNVLILPNVCLLVSEITRDSWTENQTMNGYQWLQ